MYYLSTLSIDFNKISKNKEPREEAKNHKPTLFVYQKHITFKLNYINYVKLFSY